MIRDGWMKEMVPTFADELQRIAAVAEVRGVVAAADRSLIGSGRRGDGAGCHVTALTGESFSAVDGALL